jgi:hypothetical protein
VDVKDNAQISIVNARKTILVEIASVRACNSGKGCKNRDT